MNLYIRPFYTAFVCWQLISSAFYLFPNNIIIASAFLLFVTAISLIFWYSFRKKIKQHILFSIEIYYLIPLFIALSIGVNVKLLIILLWMIFLVNALIICLIKIDKIAKKQRKYFILGLLFSMLISHISFGYFAYQTSLMLVVLMFNLFNINIKSKFNIIFPMIFAITLMLIRYYFTTYANMNLSMIMLIIYCVISSFSCLLAKGNKNKYYLCLMALFIASFIKINVAVNIYYCCLVSALSMIFFIKTPVLFSIKSKYGKISVVKYFFQNCHALFHNDIIHGIQYFDHLKKKNTYYDFEAPIGRILNKLLLEEKSVNMAVIGLGIGSLSLYAKNKNHKIDFYEIDEQIIKIAKNKDYFTIIANTLADVNIIAGDARKTLEKQADNQYDILVCDGYHGNKIESSLLTYEAFKLYMQKLKNDGILFIHSSSVSAEEQYIAKIMYELELVGYLSKFDCYKNNQHKNKKEFNGLFINNAPNILVIDKFQHYLHAFLMNFGLVINDIDNFDAEWIIINKNEQNIKHLIDKSWQKINLAEKETVLITDHYQNIYNF